MPQKNRVIIMMILFGINIMTGCSGQSGGIVEYTSAKELLESIPEYNNEKVDGVLVKIYTNKNGIIYGFEATGNPKYDLYGNDIVNAALSTVAQNTILSLKQFTKDELQETIEEEHVQCLIPSLEQEKGSTEANVLLNSATLGFYAIQENYGEEYVKLYTVKDK